LAAIFPASGRTPSGANITWRQEVGGSAIEASKIAGHSEVAMTGEYTFVGIDRQEALTRAIQERLAQAAPQDGRPNPSDAQREQMARARRAKQEKAKVVVITPRNRRLDAELQRLRAHYCAAFGYCGFRTYLPVVSINPCFPPRVT
jgi:hypothetical protein